MREKEGFLLSENTQLGLFAQFPGKSGSNLWNWLVLMYCSKAEFRAGFWVGRGTEASWKSRNAG